MKAIKTAVVKTEHEDKLLSGGRCSNGKRSLRFNKMILGLVAVGTVIISGTGIFGAALDVKAADPVVRSNISDTASEGNIIIGIEGKDVTSDQKEMIDKINAARKDACTNGITPDPRDKTRMLQPSDYVEMKIGVNCTRAAQIRAGEASLYMAHVRPNGTECLSIIKALYPSSSGWAENLAWDAGEKSNIDLWIDEKNNYLGLSSGQTGHYETIINPKFKYTGISTFNPANDSNEYDWSCTAGQYSVDDVAVGSYEAAKNETIIQKIEVPISAVTGAEISGNTMYHKGNSADISMLVGVKFVSAISTNTAVKCPVYNGVTWSSSDETVVSVSEAGHIVAKKEGSATISASIGTGEGTIKVSKEYLVTDSAVTVTGVNDPEKIIVESNKKPELPTVVKANLSNGMTSDINVTWDDYDVGELLSYFTSKEFDITGKAGGFNVKQTIHVNAAIMTGTYTDPKVITTDSGVEPVYPTAFVGMSNGYAYKEIGVNWDEESLEYYKVKEGGTFTMKGVTSYTFPTDEGGKQFPVTLTLIVKPAEGYEVSTDPTPDPTPVITPGSGGTETPGSGEGASMSSTQKVIKTSETGKESDDASKEVSVGDEKTADGAQYIVTTVSDPDKTGYSGEVTYAADNKNAVNVTIPAQVTIDGKQYKITYIENNAFKGNKKLKKVVIGKYVTKIGKNAFLNCKKLKQITFKGTSVKSIGKNAFKGVPKSAKAKAPKKVLKKYKKMLKKAKYTGKLK